MRIAIPIDENKQDICIVLSRAPYFLFQDEDLQTIVDNPATDEDLEAFAKGKLEELTHFHGGYHGNP